MIKEIIEAPDLDRFRRGDPRQLVYAALRGFCRTCCPSPSGTTTWPPTRGTGSPSRLRYLRSYPAQLPVLAGLLPRIATPVQVIAGASDTAAPPANARFLHERLPHSKLDVIDAGHFTWEDAAGEYAALVTSWWRGPGQAG